MSATVGGSGAAPDWYPDPSDANLLRYWDGERWTERTSPAGNPQPAPPGPGGGGSNKKMWIILGIVGGCLFLLVVIGILAAIAIPVYFSEQKKDADASAKADVSTLGKEIATWFVDSPQLPSVTVSDGNYLVDDFVVGKVSDNVKLGELTGTNSMDWCIYVTNSNGDKAKDGYQYSAYGGLEQGTC